MPKYQHKEEIVEGERPIILAQQWENPGDVPSWAYGIVKEFDDSFEIPTDDGATLVGARGDYIFRKPLSNRPGLIRQAFFEANYAPLVDALTSRTDLEAYSKGAIRLKNFIPEVGAQVREGYKHIPLGPLNSPPYNVHSLCIFRDILFACSDKGLLRFDDKKQEMVHTPFNPEPVEEVPA